MNFNWGAIAGAVIACACIVLGVAYLVSLDERVGTQSSLGPAAATTADSKSLVEGLNETGIAYDLLGPANTAQVQLATDTVTEQFGALLNSDTTPEVSVVVFSDPTYGKVDSVESKDPVVSPYYTNQQALMVVFPHQVMSPSMPQGVDLPTGLRLECTFVAFVEPLSGNILEATSFTETGKPL